MTDLQAAVCPITLIGVPFDATSTYRPGSRFAPPAIRQAFENIEIYAEDLDLDLEQVAIGDRGDLARTSNLSDMLDRLEAATRGIMNEGSIPAALGGEHSITYGSVKAMPQDTALIVFDAHLDLRTEYDGLRLMHATWLRYLAGARPRSKVVHVGARAAVREEWQFAREQGFSLLTTDDVFASADPVADFSGLLAGLDEVYVSIDLDVLDPAFGPGVANPEVGGLSSRQLIGFLRALRGKRLRGFDVVELCPVLDAGQITAVAAAKFLAELCHAALASPRG